MSTDKIPVFTKPDDMPRANIVLEVLAILFDRQWFSEKQAISWLKRNQYFPIEPVAKTKTYLKYYCSEQGEGKYQKLKIGKNKHITFIVKMN